MYTIPADLYDTIYHFKDYGAEAAALRELIRAHRPEAKTLLDVGCGTGRHLEYLAAHFQVEGLDINPELLGGARSRCPSVTLHEASMMDFSLPYRFDVVTVLFGSIAAAASGPGGLPQAVSNISRHLNAEGLLIIEPWFTPETYWEGHIAANFVDEPDLKVAWMYLQERVRDIAILDIHYLVAKTSGVAHFRDRLEAALLSEDAYRDAFEQADLSFTTGSGPTEHGLHIGRKSSA